MDLARRPDRRCAGCAPAEALGVDVTPAEVSEWERATRRRLCMVEIPKLRTQGGMNSREHWQARARRVRSERATVHWALVEHACIRGKPATPCLVTLTRVAPSNGLDDDNLCSALKATRDQVAEWLQVDDRHRDIVRYEYAQERGPWGVRIEFGPLSPKSKR